MPPRAVANAAVDDAASVQDTPRASSLTGNTSSSTYADILRGARTIESSAWLRAEKALLSPFEHVVANNLDVIMNRLDDLTHMVLTMKGVAGRNASTVARTTASEPQGHGSGKTKTKKIVCDIVEQHWNALLRDQFYVAVINGKIRPLLMNSKHAKGYGDYFMGQLAAFISAENEVDDEEGDSEQHPFTAALQTLDELPDAAVELFIVCSKHAKEEEKQGEQQLLPNKRPKRKAQVISSEESEGSQMTSSQSSDRQQRAERRARPRQA